VIVLVHGLGVGQRYFDRLARRLEGEVLRPELRFALPMPELAEVWAAAFDGPGLVVANSMGCQVAAELAVRRPELVEALVLVGPTVDPHARGLVRNVGRLIVDSWYEPPSLTAIVLRDYLTAGPLTTLRQARHAAAHPIEELLPLVGHEAVVVRGAHDPLCPAEWGRQAATLLPRGSLVTISGAGHAAHWSHPREVADVVRRLRGTRAAAG
jgi:pimeloyl-ACP methyl ester carboxylesterase